MAGKQRIYIESVREGKRPYNCKICESKFSTLGNLIRHMKNAHGVKRPHECQQCDSKFFKAGQLKLHVQKEIAIDLELL